VRRPRLEDACFCPVCLEDFQERTGTELPHGDTARRASFILDEHLQEWSHWKCNSIVRFCADARQVLQRERPGARLGMFSVPWSEADYDGAIRRIIGQDFALLAEHIDVFSPMAYHRMCGRPVSWIHDHALYLDGRTGRRGTWPIVQAVDHPGSLSAAELVQALEAGVKEPAGGVIVFTLKELLQEPEKLERTQQYFRSVLGR